MTFVAERADGEVVAAAQANADDDHRCLECGDRVVLRSAHRREDELVRPHFMHQAGGESCSGGESEEHRWMKAMAYAAARERWPGAEIVYEGELANRRADVLVSFGELKNRIDGRGFAIECQYRHESKDIPSVTYHYQAFRYSVLWLDEGDFGETGLRSWGVRKEWADGLCFEEYKRYDCTLICRNCGFQSSRRPPKGWTATIRDGKQCYNCDTHTRWRIELS